MGEFRWPSAVLTYNAKHKSLVFTSLVFHSLVVNTTLATVIVVARLPTLTVIQCSRLFVSLGMTLSWPTASTAAASVQAFVNKHGRTLRGSCEGCARASR
ncbi:unnamed protein product [Prorocentrum cordatum]|uniref:Uncharacterized protein n=1 Tax=Prorocentrum cordatum TaxID=2364126 RepID=A0ABN9WBL8_9DINO|nr:unnamed protein product [Polarella glacialis]